MADGDIQAFLDALKKAKGAAPDFGDDDKPEGGISIQRVSAIPVKGKGEPSPDMMDDDAGEMGDDQSSDDMNDKIVGVLEADYPEIYAKISQQLMGDEPSHDDDDNESMSSLSDMLK